MADAGSGTVIIEQLGGERRRVVLSGASLPDQGVAVPIGQRLNKQFLPGASEAIVQVLGIDLPSFTLAGSANDALIGEAGAAVEIINTLSAIVADGQPVDVFWDVPGGFGRRAYLSGLTTTWRLADLVDWSLTVDPFATSEAMSDNQITFAPADEQAANQAAATSSANLRAAQSGAGLDAALGAL